MGRVQRFLRIEGVALTIVLAGLFTGACEKKAPPTPVVDPLPVLQSDRMFSAESLTRGAGLFQEHCAACHGPDAQGHPDWQDPNVVSAPPLNGTGNEWKRAKRDFFFIIQNGATRGGKSVMPGWKGRLSDAEIEDVITWFQALWPTEVYESWRKTEMASTAPKS